MEGSIMARSRLTAKRVRGLKHDPDAITFRWDAGLPGFGVRLSKTGVRAFVLWTRHGEKKRLITLGRWPELTLDAARKAAAMELDQIDRGEDDLITRRTKRRDGMTVADGCRWFLETHVPRRLGLNKMASRTATEYRRQITRYIDPAIGHMLISEVTRQDVEKMLDARIGWSKPSQYGRVRSLARSLFNVFKAEGWRVGVDNPGVMITTPTERERTRTLSEDEQVAFHAALARMDGDPAVPVIRFLNATGCRLNEARGLKWDFVDHTTNNITLPETKTGPKVIRATSEVMDIVKGSPRINGNPYVFVGRGPAAPLGEHSIRRTFYKAAKMAGLVDVRPHDLRRSYITDALAEGVPLTTVADLVGHASIAMTSRYAQASDGQVREGGEALAAARKARRGAVILAPEFGGARA